MKKTLFPLAFAAVALTTACSDNEIINQEPATPDSLKEMISFSLSDETASTRAGFLKAETSLAMRIQSDEKNGTAKKYTRTVAKAAVDGTNSATSYSTVSFEDAYVRYWDDAHGRKSLLSVFAVAIPNGGSSIKNNGYTLEGLLARGDASNDWGANSTNTIAWQVTTTAQEKDESSVTTPTKNIDQEDLVYSNNIQADGDLGKNGVYRWDYTEGKHLPDATGATTHKNGRMLFFQNGMTDADAATKALTDAPGHFDKGHLVFNHALSRITITLVEGTGFNKSITTDFTFDTGTNITLEDMNIKGTLDIPTGEWTIPSMADGGIGNITKMAETGKGTYAADHTYYPKAAYYTLTAQMLPDYVFADGDVTNVMHFTIDGNTYFITQDMLYDALNVTANQRADYGYDGTAKKFTMMQGKNYNFTLVVNKKQIEAITATLKAWDDVNAEFAQDNTHITITTSSTGAEHNDELNLFKMEQTLDKIYTDDSYFNSAKGFSVFQGDYKTSGVANLQEMKKSDNSSYNPKQWYADGWYYKDNMTAYHLRMLNNLAANEGGTSPEKDHNVTNTSDKSSFAMKNGAQSTQDYHWGAPMIQTNDASFLKYNLTEGYTSSIHPGFVAPKNYVEKPINITELHMMSNINVVLKTTTTSNKINLRTGSGTSSDPYSFATVKITKLASTATVDMGSGLVTPSATITTEETMTRPEDNTTAGTHYFAQTTGDTPADDITTTQAFTWAVVPQELVRSSAGTGTENLVGITITTPDNNEYYVVADLSKIVPSSIGSQAGQMHNTTDAITRWYPNHSYTYTFTLTKKGIEAITCTLADWVTVTGTNTTIDLES